MAYYRFNPIRLPVYSRLMNQTISGLMVSSELQKNVDPVAVKFSWPKLFQGALLSFVVQSLGWLASYPIWLLILISQYGSNPTAVRVIPAHEWAELFWILSGLFVYLPTWLFFTLPIYAHLWLSRPVFTLRSLIFWVLGTAIGGSALSIGIAVALSLR